MGKKNEARQAAKNDSKMTPEREAQLLAPWLIKEQITQAPCDSLAGYNDAPGRTHAEVLAVFDAALRLAESTP